MFAVLKQKFRTVQQHFKHTREFRVRAQISFVHARRNAPAHLHRKIHILGTPTVRPPTSTGVFFGWFRECTFTGLDRGVGLQHSHTFRKPEKNFGKNIFITYDKSFKLSLKNNPVTGCNFYCGMESWIIGSFNVTGLWNYKPHCSAKKADKLYTVHQSYKQVLNGRISQSVVELHRSITCGI